MVSKGYKVLCHLNRMRKSRTAFSEAELRNRTKIFDRDGLVKLCKSLYAAGYLDSLAISPDGTIQNIELSYTGMTYRAERRRAIRKYIADKWIDVFALLIAILSLILSIVSLVKG